MAEYKREPVIQPHVLEKKLKKQELQILRANGSRCAGVQDSVGQGYLCGPFVKLILYCGH